MEQVETSAPAIKIVETIALSEILYVYEHNPVNFVYMCFAIAKIFENRKSFDVTNRGDYPFISPEMTRFRDPYDCLQRACPGMLSQQTEAQLLSMLREIGYNLQGLDSDSFTVSMLCALEGTTMSYHKFRIQLLKQILEVKSYACFHFVING